MKNSPAPTVLLDTFVRESKREPMIADIYTAPITNQDLTTVDDAVRSFFESSPGWVVHLMRARNRVVGALGFEVGDPDPPRMPSKLSTGHRVGVFSVCDRSDIEVLLGIDDTHFTMRLSIGVDDATRTLALATVAYPTDRIGRIYLTVVKPFHKPIAASMAKRCGSLPRIA